ncbi:MAG TPA: oxaloacetate decarboxylase [Clostridia bacterium]|nr:oxaloacetate decarboxylase [Clostridia bacterium]
MFLVTLAQIALKWQPESLAESLKILAFGMLGIFLVICVIWIFVALLNRLTKQKKES